MTARKGDPCPIAGCTAHAKPRQLMCWPHWRRVPKPLNHAVFDTFRAYDTAKPGTGIDDRYLEYLAARDAAIAAVEAKEAAERDDG